MMLSDCIWVLNISMSMTILHYFSRGHSAGVKFIKASIRFLMFDSLKLDEFLFVCVIYYRTTKYYFLSLSRFHLGLKWVSRKFHPDVNKKIQTARRTAYSMLGLGLHGLNGLEPKASYSMLLLYVIPRLQYGPEACVLQRNSTGVFYDKYRVFRRALPLQLCIY